MADPFDKMLSESVYEAISRPGVLEGENVNAHKDCTVIVIGNRSPFPSPPSFQIANLQIYTDTNNIGLYIYMYIYVLMIDDIYCIQRDPNSPRAPNPSSTAPCPPRPPSPSSTCPRCRKRNSSAKPKSPTPSLPCRPITTPGMIRMRA